MKDERHMGEPTVEQFKNLKSLYNHLERHAADYEGAHRISSLFEAIYKLKEAEGKRNKADKALWERKFFAVQYEVGEPKNWCDHIVADFDENTYDYAATRLENTQNPILRARYAHVLWSGPNKVIAHARIAIDSYLEAAKVYEQKDCSKPNERWGFEVIFAILNAYGLAIRTKYRIQEVKVEVLRLVRHFNPKSSWSFRVRQELIEVVLRDKHQFKKPELAGLQDVCWWLASDGMKSQREASIQEAKDMLNLGEKIDKRLKQTSHDWSLRRGKCYEILIQIRQEGDLAIPSFCLDAIENYRKAGKTAKVRTLETRYAELAASVRLSKITVRIDQTEAVKRGRELAQKVAKWQPQKVISFLIHQQELFPRYADIKKRVSAGDIEPILMEMPSTTIDDRGHASRHFSTDDERLFRLMAEMYEQELAYYKLPVIRQVLFQSIRNGKLSQETLNKYLQQKSWLGKTLCVKSPTHGMRRYRWLDLLEASLDSYFGKTLRWLRDGTNTPNLVLEIDSLTLKFEGLLRDLLGLAGVATFRLKRQDRSLAEERYVGDLLYKKEMRHLFGEDDLFFLRFLLSEDAGYDLRNRVAHCLILAEDYSINYMHLLLLALLKLAKYDLAQNNEIVASRDGSAFHLASCMLVRRILVKNRIALPNSRTASKKGYAACRVCKPEHSEPAKHLRTNTSNTQQVLVVRS